MVFQSNFIAVIKCSEKVLRESNENGTQVVMLPFGSDYSLLLKNKDSRSALVNVDIDGSGVLGGNELVIRPNSETELQGFMENGTVRNRFRFIQKTQEISDHRGDRIDDGIVHITFRYEQVQQDIVVKRHFYDDHYHHYHRNYPWDSFPPIVTWSNDSGITGYRPPLTCYPSQTSDASQVIVGVGAGLSESFVASACSFITQPLSEEGITVRGESTYQPFRHASIGQLEQQSHVINIVLRGITSIGEVVSRPITTTEKLKCSSCGTEWASSHTFCGKCGTFLR